MKLEKLKVLDKINDRLSKIEYDIKNIKGNVGTMMWQMQNKTWKESGESVLLQQDCNTMYSNLL